MTTVSGDHPRSWSKITNEKAIFFQDCVSTLVSGCYVSNCGEYNPTSSHCDQQNRLVQSKSISFPNLMAMVPVAKQVAAGQ
jgi:hypothetical protein